MMELNVSGNETGYEYCELLHKHSNPHHSDTVRMYTCPNAPTRDQCRHSMIGVIIILWPFDFPQPIHETTHHRDTSTIQMAVACCRFRSSVDSKVRRIINKCSTTAECTKAGGASVVYCKSNDIFPSPMMWVSMFRIDGWSIHGHR